MTGVALTFLRDATTGQVLLDVNGYPQFAANTGANTYGALQARIQNEVLGSPTTSDIQDAIQDAITQFEREPFYFNDMRTFGDVSGSLSDLQTTAGKEFYSSADLPIIANIPYIRHIMVLAFANRYELRRRTPEWIDDQSVSTTWQGLPTDWCWQGQSIRIFPVPNGTYPLILDGTIRFPPLVQTTDYNCWMNEAERLIRLEAKRILFVDIIRDAQQAQMMEAEIYGPASFPARPGRVGELSRLRAESRSRMSSGTIRPSRGYF